MKNLARSLSTINSYLIPVNEAYLIYSPLVNVTALINLSGVLELREQIRLIKTNRGNPESRLFILAKDILDRNICFPTGKAGPLNPDFLGIIPTRACNGACNYCDFGEGRNTSEKMSYELAVKAVDWYSDIIKKNNGVSLEIHFFGGEPMMARDVIETVVQRARLIASGENFTPWFEISTNGQYNKADAIFLGHYFNKVVLSFDGFKEVQNRHRPLKSDKSSYENTIQTAKIISESDADLCIRCCISQINVSRMEDFTEWLCQNLRLSAINFEVLCATEQTTLTGILPPDPIEFAIHFQKSRETGNRYGVEVVYSSDISGVPVESSCPVGKDVVIVSPDGRLSCCYLMPERWQGKGLDFDFGFLKDNESFQTDMNKIDEIRAYTKNKPKCSKCFCKWSCAGGCHVGITYPGCGLEYSDFCIQTRIISAFSLLTDLGFSEKIKELIQSPETLKKLATQPTDLLIHRDE
jgi:uncharacterized protein